MLQSVILQFLKYLPTRNFTVTFTKKSTVTMAKREKHSQHKTPPNRNMDEKGNLECSAIELDKSNNIIIKISAKPGAKQNCITDISPEGIGVQINAPPSEGAANTELIKFIANVLGVRKGNIILEKGFKSRQKILKVLTDLTKKEVEERIQKELQS